MKSIEIESDSLHPSVSADTRDETLTGRRCIVEANRFPKRLPSIQILRGIAAALVVVYHFSLAIEKKNSNFSWLISRDFANPGAAGVDIFFVISGFIMFYTTTRNNGLRDAGSFLWKRALRIYPLYWFWSSILLCIVISNLFPGAHSRPSFNKSEILYLVGSYLLIPIFNGIRFHPFLDQGWTLSFEILFYIVFALGLALKLRRLMPWFLSLAFGGLFMFGLLQSQGSGFRYLLSNTLVLEFLFGVFLAKGFLENRFDFLRNGTLWLPTGVIALGCAILAATAIVYSPVHWYTPEFWRFALWGLPSALIVLGFACAGERFANPVLEFIGDASFSTYLSHSFVLGAFRAVQAHIRVLSVISPDLEIVVASLLTISLTLLTYQFVEKPLISVLRGNWRRGAK